MLVQKLVNYLKAEKLYWVNILTTFISQGITAVTMILATPILFNGLGAANFGIYSVLLNLVVLFSIIDFGANLGIIRKMIHQNSKSKKLVPTLFYFYLLLSVLLVPVIYGYLHYSVHWNENNMVYALVIAAIIVCNISSILFDSVLQSLHVIYLTKLIRSFKTIVEFLGWIYFIKLGSIGYLLLVSLLVNIVYIFILYRAVQKRFSFSLSFSAFSFTALKNHIRYSIWYFIAAVAVVLIYNMQIVLFNQYTSTILVAHLFIVTKFYEIIRVAVSNFSQVLYPKIIQMEASQNWAGIRKMYFSSIMKAFFLTTIIALIIINFGDIVFIKWSKLSDEATLQLFHYYLFFILLVIIDNVSVIYLAALKLNAVPTIVSFCQGILSVVFTYLLINKYGLMGAFYASIASFIITNMLFNPFYLLRKIKVRSYNPIA